MRSKEDSLQIAVADYLRLQYPKALWIHCPNGGSRNAIEGAKLKKMGVKKGVPDILIFEPKGDYHCGLAIELKIAPNKATKEQIDFLADLEKRGWQCELCFDFNDAKEIIDDYFKNN